MTVKKLTERQIRWSLILFKYDFVINYITGKNNERADVFSKREQNVPEAGDNKLEYKMAQLLKPKLFNFEPWTNERPEFDQSETLNFIEIQPVVTGKNRVDIQPIFIETPENELENLWATAKNNDDVYQSVVGAIKKGKRILFTFLVFKFFIGDCSLNNNETFFFKKKWVFENELFRTQLIQRIHDFLLIGHFWREISVTLMFKNYFWLNVLLNIRRFVRNCDVCGRNKIWKKKKRFFEAPAYTEPNSLKNFYRFCNWFTRKRKMQKPFNNNW